MKVNIPLPPEPVSVNGLPFEPEDYHRIVVELDNRRRQYHVRARDAKTLGTQQAEAAKAEHLDQLIRVLTYAGKMVDPDDARTEENWKAKAREKRWRKRHGSTMRQGKGS